MQYIEGEREDVFANKYSQQERERDNIDYWSKMFLISREMSQVPLINKE